MPLSRIIIFSLIDLCGRTYKAEPTPREREERRDTLWATLHIQRWRRWSEQVPILSCIQARTCRALQIIATRYPPWITADYLDRYPNLELIGVAYVPGPSRQRRSPASALPRRGSCCPCTCEPPVSTFSLRVYDRSRAQSGGGNTVTSRWERPHLPRKAVEIPGRKPRVLF